MRRERRLLWAVFEIASAFDRFRHVCGVKPNMRA